MLLRIERDVDRDAIVTVMVDGRAVAAYAGETVATALRAAGFRGFRSSPRLAEPRGLFCGMGICQECVLRVNGRRVPACQQLVGDGMVVETTR